MEIEAEYLDKVLIYSNQTLIGTYKPTIDKKTCRPNPLDFQNVDIRTIIKNINLKDYRKKPSKTSLKTISRIRKDPKKTSHIIKLDHVDFKLLKNNRYNEYIIFLTQDPKVESTDTVFLELLEKNRKPYEKPNKNKTNILTKYRKRIKKPKNYKNLIGIEKLFEETIKNELISSLNAKNLVVSAIFQTNSKQTPKAFLTQPITNLKDIKSFMGNMKIMNCNKTVNYQNLTLQHVVAFIVLNKHTQKLCLELTDSIRNSLKRTCLESQIIQYGDKQFINADLLNVKLRNLKWYVLKTYKSDVLGTKSEYSINNTNSMVSINEYSFANLSEMIQQYEENMMANYNVSQSTDDIVRETYKLLIELQINAINQCNQLYYNYFTNKINWPKENVAIFSNKIQKMFDLLVYLQNKAIENSIFTNKRLKRINKFLSKLSDDTRAQNRELMMPQESKSTTNWSIVNLPRNITSISDSTVKRHFSQTLRITRRNAHEMEVQTSLSDVKNLLQQVAEINKCNKGCSALNINDLLMDRKCVQTDISVNKETSIDCGGKCVQIYKKNIYLAGKPNTAPENKVLPQVSISASEEDILSRLTKKKFKRNTINAQNNNQESCKAVAAKETDKDTITDTVKKTANDSAKKTVKETAKDCAKETVKDCDKETVKETAKEIVKETAKKTAKKNAKECVKEIVAEVTEETCSDLEEKINKLSVILKVIQEENVPKQDAPCTDPKLTTILEEPKSEEVKLAAKNEEIIHQIKNSLQQVKERFEKNSQILQKVTDLKDNFMLKKLMETPKKAGHFPRKTKFIKNTISVASDMQSFSSSTTVRSVQDTKNEITKNLHTSLQLLKNLNEVTKSIKVSPQAAMIRLNEIEESIQLQRRLAPKFKYEKTNLTLTPIKNFINSNKMKVTNSAKCKVEGKRKSKLIPGVSSKHIVEYGTTKKSKKRSKSCGRKIQKPSTSTIKIQKPPQPSIQSSWEVPFIPKIYRPVTPKVLPDTPKLSALTLTDVAPFQPEYPRKDNLSHIEVEKSYLYKLLNNSFSEKGLEPLIVCSNKDCASCTTLNVDKKTLKKPKSRNSNTERKSKNSNLLWEKMHWNTEITCQADHDNYFKKYMNDPNFKLPQTITACPVNITLDKNNEKNMSQTVENNFKVHSVAGARKAPVIPGNPKLSVLPSKAAAAKSQVKAQNSLQQAHVQNSIQQAILRNQERFKIIEQSLTSQRNQNAPKFKKAPPKAPKIISSGTLSSKKIVHQTKINPQSNKNEVSSTKKAQRALTSKDDNHFNKKYKENISMPTSKASARNREENGVLDEISEVVKTSQADMHKYIELVEQKFLKTFSLPETEKATAYTSLESEIKEMLHLINTTKDKHRENEENKTEPISPKPNSGKTSKQPTEKQPTEKPKTPKTLNKHTKAGHKQKKNTETKQKKSETVIVIKKPEPDNFISGSEVAMKDKKKACENTRPTICTGPIKFPDSFSAIVTKPSTLFPSPFKIESKNSLPILKFNNLQDSNLQNSNLENSNLQISKSNTQISNLQKSNLQNCNSQNCNLQNCNSQNCNLQNCILQNSSSKTDNKKVRFQVDGAKNTVSNSTVTMSTDEDYSTFYEETISDNSSDIGIAHILITHNTDFCVFISVKTLCCIEYPYCNPEIYYVIVFYEQTMTKTLIMPENYDYKFLCNNDSFQYSINFEPDSLRPTEVLYQSDSFSEFLVNCDELIERTKKLHLDRKKSPEILEFLNVITSISVEHLGLKKEQYYRFMSNVSFLKHTSQVHYMLQTFQQPICKDIGDTPPLSKCQTIRNELGLIKNNFPTSNIVPYQNIRLHKNFSESEFSNLLFKHNFPISEELVKCCSDTNCLKVFASRKEHATICQTLVLNLQVQSCGHKSKNVRRSIRKKCFVLPYKNKFQVKNIEVNLGLDKKILVETVYTKLLIIIYFLVYSFAFLLLTFNYTCE